MGCRPHCPRLPWARPGRGSRRAARARPRSPRPGHHATAAGPLERPPCGCWRAAAHLKRYPAAPDDYVFRTQQGTPTSPQWLSSQVMAQAVKAAGLPMGTSPHDLRHAYASMLIHGGESVKAVSERLGHTNAAMTLNVYAHLMPESEDRTRKAVDDAFSAACAPEVPSAVGNHG
ncbi:tyrosine-type recombinase/integrase [Streptomyces sp. NPDC020747]|uniref:tyrosine-type recombinase/integrase n=1 Tax=Streptomyces sp. NPDC020747 TaxID=3365086 RepID=UPI0037B6DEFE